MALGLWLSPHCLHVYMPALARMPNSNGDTKTGHSHPSQPGTQPQKAFLTASCSSPLISFTHSEKLSMSVGSSVLVFRSLGSVWQFSPEV